MRSSVFLFLAATAFGAENRIHTPVDPNRTTVLRAQVHPLAQARYDQGAADPAMELRYVTLFLKPDASLGNFLGKGLTPEQFADRFGLSHGDIGAITAWLTSQGLRVNDVARGRHWVTFSGTAAQVDRALHTELHRYLVNGKMHFANASVPSVPEALAPVVAGFQGLDDFNTGITPPTVTPDYNDGNASSGHALAPGDLAAIYDVNPLYQAGIDGTGQTIVIIGQSDLVLSDLAAFRQMFGLPVNPPTPMLFGPDPGTNGALLEADLDLEWAGAMAPKASLIYAYAGNFTTAVQYAVDQDLGPVISLSYGFCELYETSAFEAVAQQANAQGITMVVASGDSGGANCDRGNSTPQASTGPAVSWPADFPEVTAVGGTEFNEGGGAYWASQNGAGGGSAVSYIPEMAWNDSVAINQLAAGGGGASILFSKPAWQTGPGVPNDNARDIPDVSLTASYYHDPFVIVSGGQQFLTGGTSGPTPSFAGIVALLNQYLVTHGTVAQPGLGNINPVLYQMAQTAPSAFHDITVGNNAVPCVQSTTGCVDGTIGYAAGPGYDLATGLGSVDAFNLVTNWNRAISTTTTLTANPNRTIATLPVQLTATVQGGGAAPSGSVSFVLHGVGLFSEITLGTVELTGGSGGAATATLNTTGGQVAIGNGTLEALYSGDAVYESSAGSTEFSLKLPPVGSSLALPFVTPNPVTESASGVWQYAVALTEAAGVATTLTGFSIDGVPQNLALWTSTNLPANGTIYASLNVTMLAAPLNRVFVFTGRDASGLGWSQQMTVPFLAGSGSVVTPGISLTTATPVVPRNPSASCPWSQQLSVQEQGGFLTLLAGLTVNGVNYASQIQTVFGATRLAPYGFLQGNLCLSAAGPVTVQLTGVSDSGEFVGIVTGTATSILQGPPATPVQWALGAPGYSPTADTIPVNFSGDSAAWTVSVGPANRATGWLTVAPQSGTGSGVVTASLSPQGLSPGAYSAVLTFASPNAQPQVINQTITLTVGGSSAVSIDALVNNWSGQATAAPGMIAAVYGAGMAPAGTSLVAQGLPLPLTLGGVSATVNGVAAPLYYVSPGQVDVQIPYETGAGTAVLAIDNNGRIATFAFPVAVTAPGLFGSAIDNTTGSLVSSAPAGQVLQLYMTGEGDVTPTLATGASPFPEVNASQYPVPRLPVAVSVGGVPAKVLFQAIPYGLAGATQIDLVVPSGAPAGPQEVVVTVGGVAAPGVMLTVLGN